MIVGYRENLEDLENNETLEDVILIWDFISSENYIEYTICASGTEYEATEDGYVVVLYETNEKNTNIGYSIIVNNISNSSNTGPAISGIPNSIFMPIAKNNIFKVYYNKEKPTWIRLFKAKNFKR